MAISLGKTNHNRLTAVELYDIGNGVERKGKPFDQPSSLSRRKWQFLTTTINQRAVNGYFASIDATEQFEEIKGRCVSMEAPGDDDSPSQSHLHITDEMIAQAGAIFIEKNRKAQEKAASFLDLFTDGQLITELQRRGVKSKYTDAARETSEGPAFDEMIVDVVRLAKKIQAHLKTM